jgi:hypothetical protein
MKRGQKRRRAGNVSPDFVTYPGGEERMPSDSVELMGIEPTASRVRFWRSPS